MATTIFKNTALVTGGSMLLKLLNFLFSIYVVRQLGDERFGQYSIVLGFVGLVQIIAELGISQYVMREVSKDKSNAKKYFWNLIVLRLLLAGTGIVIITYASKLVGYSPQIIFGVFLYACTFIPSAFAAPIKDLLVANERFGYMGLIEVVRQVFFILFGAIFMYAGFSYVWLIVATLISFVPGIVIGVWAIKRNSLIDFPFKITPSIWPSLLKAGLPFGVISLALSIDFSVDTFMLSMYVPDNHVGWYNVSYGLLRSALFIFAAFNNVIVPSLTKVYANDKETVERWYRYTVKIHLIAAIPFSLGGTLIAAQLFDFLYTPEYLPAVLVFQIIIWDAPVLLFSSFCGRITTIISKENLAMRIYSSSAVFNILMNIIMIPRFGILGAAYITVITDVFIAAQYFVFLNKTMKLPSIFAYIFKVFLASGIMGALVWLARDINLFVVIGGAILVYFVLVWYLKVLNQEEVDILRGFLKRIQNRVNKMIHRKT